MKNMKTNKKMTGSNFRLPAILAAAICAAFTSHAATTAGGGAPAPYQAPVDPLSLPIVGPVMQAGSDAASASFDQNVLPEALAFIQANLPDAHNNTGDAKAFSVDPSMLVLAAQTSLQATFISESAGFNNTLGFNTSGIGVNGGNPELILPSASSPEDFNPNPANNYGPSNPSQPLLPGDFVNLGTFAAGTPLNFFLIADGANGGTTVYNSGGAAANPDGFAHAGGFTPSVFAVPQLNSPYIFINFKDEWNQGDKDFNDVIFAVNVGAATVHSLLATPEPSMYLTLGGFLAVPILVKRRMDRRAAATAK
jgi:hypothetical protein